MMSALPKPMLVLGLAVALLGGGGEARPAAEPKPPDDVRMKVRVLLEEAEKALLDEKASPPDAQALGTCAVLQARLGDADAARKTLLQARVIVRVLGPTGQYEQWRQLAQKHGEAGEVKGLQEMLKEIPDPGLGYGGTLESARATVIRESARALVKAGRGKEALELAKDMPHVKDLPFFDPEPTRVGLLRDIALYHAGRGELKEAQRAVDSIADPEVKVRALAGSNYIPRTPTMDLPAEPGIALIQHEAGDRDGARRTLEQAQKVAGEIKEPDRQAIARSAIVSAQARVGDLPAALETLKQVPAESDYHALGLMAIARAQAAAGKKKEALQTVEKLKTPAFRVRGLAQVIQGQAEAGDLKAARATGEKALERIKTLPERQRGSPLSHLLNARARAKDVAGALDMASQMPSSRSAFAYSNIAYYQAMAGDTKGALRTVKEHFSRDSWKRRTLEGIARVQTERGGEKKALEWVSALDSPGERGHGLLGIAAGLLQRHKIDARGP